MKEVGRNAYSVNGQVIDLRTIREFQFNESEDYPAYYSANLRYADLIFTRVWGQPEKISHIHNTDVERLHLLLCAAVEENTNSLNITQDGDTYTVAGSFPPRIFTEYSQVVAFAFASLSANPSLNNIRIFPVKDNKISKINT